MTTEERRNDEETQPETHDLFLPGNTEEKNEAEAVDISDELAVEEVFDTQQSDGHTHNPHLAQDQGLTYTPPVDPPIVPGDDPQGAEIAAGFDTQMETDEPRPEKIPPRIDDNRLDLQNDIQRLLRYNSETRHLTDLKIQVKAGGLVRLLGTVPTQADRGLVETIIGEIDSVAEIENHLQVSA